MKLLLLIILFTSVVCASAQSRPTYSPTFYKLSLQWYKSTCAARKPGSCKKLPQNPIPFTIHGLWALNSSDMVNCNNPLAKLPTLPLNIQKRLDIEWPNFIGPNQMFWDYEWGKHGACILAFSSAKDYFSQTLSIRDNLIHLLKSDIEKFLTTSGLPPTNSGTYFSERFLMAFNKPPVGIMPMLQCNTDLNGQLQLHELHFCTDNHFQLVNCTASLGVFAGNHYNNCGRTNIRYPR